MLNSFLHALDAAPDAVRPAALHSRLHRPSKVGPTAALLLGTGGSATIVSLDQGQTVEAGESAAMKTSALRVFGIPADWAHELLEAADAYLATDEARARELLGFEPVVSVLFLRADARASLPENPAVEHFGGCSLRGPALVVLYALVTDPELGGALMPLGMTEEARLELARCMPLQIV